MKKIGIMTFCNANNYGAVLQAYTLSNYLSSFGKVELINISFNLGNKHTEDGKQIQSLWMRIFNKIKRMKFEWFRNKELNISEIKIAGDKEIGKITKDYDIFIAGSDQIWNTDITNQTQAFFLNFVKERKKISYAASYGKKELSELEILWSKEYLKSFDFVSVREIESAKFLSEQLGVFADTVCDPVFLLDVNEWEKKLKHKKKRNKYVLVYYMETNQLLEDTVNSVRRCFQLPVIAIKGGREELSGIRHVRTLGPFEFIEIIRGAEIVITNSFHASAFSIIFGRKLIVLEHSLWNLRIENLINVVGMENKILRKNQDIEIASISKYIIDGKEAYANLKSFIDKSKNFLKKAIE